MGSDTRNPRIVHFGDCALDLNTAELRRNGTKTSLQSQPFQILTALLENPGQLVTREELTKRLWPTGTFVDFDQSLNKAVARLRETLGDSAENPLYIETLSRRGYRWKTSVQWEKQQTTLPERTTRRMGKFVAMVDQTPPRRQVMGIAGLAVPRWPGRKWFVSATAIVFIVVLGLVTMIYLGGSRTRVDSVAVLPFMHSSSNPDTEYLSDGITEGIIDRLSELPHTKVISRVSAFRYKGRDIEIRKVARELGVEALVTGRVTQHGNDISVSAELVDASQNRQLWGRRFNRKLSDINSLQQEIAIAISENLRVHLTDQEKIRKVRPSPMPDAYRLYLKGRYLANQATSETLRKSIDYFQQSIERDPDYALAYVGLAESNNILGAGLNYQSPNETLPVAKRSAMKALELDGTLAEAHAALGYAEWFYDWDWQSAEREFKRAIELNPNSSISHQHYAEYLLTRSRFDESAAELKEAQALDPLSPIADNIGHIYWVTRRYDEAISDDQRILDLHPDAVWIRAQLAWAYALKGMYPQAFAEYDKIADDKKVVSGETQLVTDGLGWLFAVAGRRNEALRIIQGFKKLSSHTYVDFYQLGTIYAGLGDKDEAFRMLAKGCEQHSASMPYLTIDPFWDSMRSDPRYEDLLRQMGLPTLAK